MVLVYLCYLGVSIVQQLPPQKQKYALAGIIWFHLAH